MKFGKYGVVGRVGAGSTGVVWLANDPSLDRQVAIKQLAPELVSNDRFRARFRGEARVLASLSSPNVVAVYDYVEEPERAYLVEEWVDGSSLARVVEAAGRLTPAQAVGVLRGALHGLATAHVAGLVHGDVTPGNVVVAQDGTSKLIDFGLSVPSGSVGTSGTPGYASPEAVDGTALDARSDVYSAACVLFELLAGRPPYQGDTADSIAAQQVAAEVPRLPDVHPRLADVVARAMAKDPAMRPQDASAFLRELEEEADRDLGIGWDAAASVASLAIAATVTTVAVDAATSASSASTAHHALSTAPRTGLRHMPKKWVIAMSVGAGVAAIAIIAALTLGSGDGGHTSAVVVTGDPAQQAALGQAGPSGQSSGRASTAAPEGRFAITISGDRSGSIVGTGTCSLGSGPPSYAFDRATDSVGISAASSGPGGSQFPASVKVVFGDAGFLSDGGGITVSKDQRKVTVNADASGSVKMSPDQFASAPPQALHVHIGGTVTCT